MSEFLRLFAATLLGAGVSFASTYFFERRRGALERAREEQKEAREIRRALRLLWHELIGVSAEIEIARQDREWWSRPPHDFSLDLWRANRDIAASLLDDADWSALNDAFDEIRGLNVRLGMARDGIESRSDMFAAIHGEDHARRGPWDEGVTDVWEDTLMRVQTPIDLAIEQLRPLLRQAAEEETQRA